MRLRRAVEELLLASWNSVVVCHQRVYCWTRAGNEEHSSVVAIGGTGSRVPWGRIGCREWFVAAQLKASYMAVATSA